MRIKGRTQVSLIVLVTLLVVASILAITLVVRPRSHVPTQEDRDLDNANGQSSEIEVVPEKPDQAEEMVEPLEIQQTKNTTVAWQPSHQDDTGDAEWHEYLICSDIVERTMFLCNNVSSVRCWDTSHGLTGTNNYKPQPTNTPAFDVEVSIANVAEADYFIAIHNDGGAPSGVLGICTPGDQLSRSFLEKFLAALCAHTGLTSRGIWEVRLYSLEPERNSCPCRILLEIGDNQNDRALLEDEGFRQKVAQALAEVADGLPPLR